MSLKRIMSKNTIFKKIIKFEISGHGVGGHRVLQLPPLDQGERPDRAGAHLPGPGPILKTF